MKQITKNNFLEQVIEIKKEEVKLKKRIVSDVHKARKKNNLFFDKLKECRGGRRTFIIAEIKLSSPTEKNLGQTAQISKRVKIYEQAGADAISIITDKSFFGGDIKYISQIKSLIKIPVLQKDFIIDDSQIIESINNGADALLLIAKILDTKRLIRFVNLCMINDVEPVVEINDQEDLEKAKVTKARIIAVNARNLSDLSVNISGAQNLLRQIPDKYIKLAFSGISSNKEVISYEKSGAAGVLVGTSLMKSSNIERFLISLRFKNDVRVKICGIKSIKEAVNAINSGADIIGFNFVKTSKRYISLINALKIVKKIKGQAQIAAIFQNNKIDEALNIVDKMKPDYVQLHGDEEVGYIKLIKNTQIIKSVNDSAIEFDFGCKYILIDRKKQGSGKMFDVAKAKKVARIHKIFFAGGLTPGNVSEVVKKVNPYAVDVAGGVETNGIKDKNKMREFIMSAKGVEI